MGDRISAQFESEARATGTPAAARIKLVSPDATKFRYVIKIQPALQHRNAQRKTRHFITRKACIMIALHKKISQANPVYSVTLPASAAAVNRLARLTNFVNRGHCRLP